jgi:two-component system response regulator PilR (NtrC family)
MKTHQALIVDDEADIRELLQLTLKKMDIRCQCAPDLADAYKLLKSHSFDLCLTDMKLPDGTGLDLVKHVQAHHDKLPIAVITAYGNMQTAIDALKFGAFDFISKPVQLNSLRSLVKSALKLEDETQDLPVEEEILQGNSESIEHIRQMIRKLARSQAPVHIQGESGTGKELAARQIHLRSARHDKSFIPINCGAIPSELMESEFFGHKKGSFTGATHDKHGLFQAADGGTLFLDEVAELPADMQVKLLRAIQERAIRPVGEHKEQQIDVRILSATNKDLKTLVDNNLFRNDLYFRLNVIELQLPPLRERGDDIRLLAESILKSLNKDLQLDNSAISALMSYSYPGNIRELKNILERATALTDGNTIAAEDLYLPKDNDSGPGETSSATSSRGSQSLEEFLEKIEHDEIEMALNKCRWNRTNAARLLGISTRQLRYRMSKLKMSD